MNQHFVRGSDRKRETASDKPGEIQREQKLSLNKPHFITSGGKRYDCARDIQTADSDSERDA